MKNKDKTKDQLITELATLKKSFADLKKSETKLKKLEKSHRDRGIGYKSIFDSATDAFLIFDLNGEIVQANPQARNMHGYPHEEIIGLTGKDIVHPEDYHLFEQFLRDIKTKGEFQTKSVDVRKDGTPFVAEVKGTEFVYKGKKHLLAIVRDITDRKLIETNLRKSEEKLRSLSSQLLRSREKERKRISRGLHDELGHSVSLLKLRLRSIEKKLLKEQIELKKDCEDLRDYIDNLIEDVRRLSEDLSPSILDNLGLSAALEWLIDRFTRHYNIKVSIDLEEIDHLFSPEAKINIFRLIQESLTNIAKHAQASHMEVVIKRKNDTVFFLVKDNGKGFDIRHPEIKNSTEKGWGLTIMDERLKMLGGSLEIMSKKGEGTRINFSIPI